MYYVDYDPSLHDVYLYGPGNTGYPIGVNPNSLIAGASADFRTILPRFRNFTGTGPVSIPPGTTAAYLPNYYNVANSPLMIVLGDSTIASTVHYLANKPSDTNFDNLAKYTGTTTAYPITSLSFWNSSFSGLCAYGPWTGIYNCVPVNQITGATSYAYAKYFPGSPEIPGFATGATFYQILSNDYGFMDLLGSGPTLSQPIAKIISIGALANDVALQGNTVEYRTVAGDQSIVYLFVQTPDLYLWDGCDKIIPIPELYVRYMHQPDNTPVASQELFVVFSGTAVPAETAYAGNTYAAWVGDSSSQVIYKKNNSLYFVGTITALGSSSFILGSGYFYLTGPLYAADVYPLYNFLGSREIDRNHYWYPLNQGLTLATQIDFTRIESALNNLSTALTDLYQKFI